MGIKIKDTWGRMGNVSQGKNKGVLGLKRMKIKLLLVKFKRKKMEKKSFMKKLRKFKLDVNINKIHLKMFVRLKDFLPVQKPTFRRKVPTTM